MDNKLLLATKSKVNDFYKFARKYNSKSSNESQDGLASLGI